MPTISADVIRLSARRELCKRSFPDFLAECRILSDDPSNPEPIAFEPWDYQLERAEAWGGGQSEVVLKARQLGFSWLLAAYMLWRADLWGWNVGYYSSGEDAARYEIDQRVLFIYRRLPAWLQADLRQRDTFLQFDRRGSIRAFPSTETAGIGYTFQLVIADECAFHAYGAVNYAAYRPTLSAGGQYIACSTANPELGTSGFFYDLWQAAVDNANGYAPVFIPWSARPDRDEAWLERERAAFTGLPEEFDAYYPATAAEAFIGKSGLVFPQFTKDRHVRKAPVLWEKCEYRCAGYDLGGGDPTAVVLLGAYKSSTGYKVHQYAEKTWQPAPAIDELYAYLASWHDRGPFLHVECDPAPGGKVTKESLRRLGLPARIANWDRKDGLGLVATYLERDWITYDESCTQTVKEFGQYYWVERIDPHDRTRYKTHTPRDHHADCMDAGRYALMGLHKYLMNRGGRRIAYAGVHL